MSTKGNLKQVESPRFEVKAGQPVATFSTGNVRTRVWANPTLWGEVTWAVDQGCVTQRDGSSGETKTFGPADLNEARRGFNLAERYIKEVERRRHLLRLAFWK